MEISIKDTGVGIILIKDFVEKNGGELYVESEPGSGTDFRFTLPAHA
ncbi:MAG: ATP-binding protein [Mangrovibacterium sp.]